MSAGCRARRAAGFTLTEVLVAVAILLVTGGAVAALVLDAFGLFEHGATRSCRLVADDRWQTLLARDFASCAGGRGFEGDAARCRFWTLEAVAPGTCRLSEVEYRLEEQAVFRRIAPPGGAAFVEERIAPVRAPRMAYAAGSDAPAAWRETWQNPTSAPARLHARSQWLRDEEWVGRHLRRTTP